MANDQQLDPRAAGLTITTAAGAAGDVRVTAAGGLDYYSAEGFARAVHDALEAAPVVTADLAAVTYCDSSGLAALVRSHKAAQRSGRRFTVYSPDPVLNRMFVLTGLDTVLDIVTTLP